jgi:hypothetical protein
MLQQGRAPEDVVALVMTTHEVAVDRMAKALSEIEALSSVMAPPVSMPVLVGDLEG